MPKNHATDKKKIDNFNKDFINYCIKNNYIEDLFLNYNNYENYAKTCISAYKDYPLIQYIFNNKVDDENYYNMIKLDLKTRLNKSIGIATKNYESVLILEAPFTKKIGNIDYLKNVKFHDLYLLFLKATNKQNAFEKYALKKRREYLDKKTCYIYIFATKKEFQRTGYGKTLMNLVINFAKEYNYNLCLETNLEDNIKMYEDFGFKCVHSSIYKNQLNHFVMFYENNNKHI